MNIKKNSIFLIIFHAGFATSPTKPFDFTFKGLTSWIKGAQEETFFKEIPFETDGTLILENDCGTITVKSWSFPKVAIEALKKAPPKELPLLDIETSIVSDQLVIRSLNTSKNGSIHYQLIVPTNTNIICKGKDCTIKTKNISGMQNITTNDSIDVQGACNSIQAQSLGAISIGFSNLPPHASISLKSIKNSIALTLPTLTNASLNATTLYNSIISRQSITLNPTTLVLNKQSWDQLKKSINGIVGMGGALIEMSAYNGITIH